MNLSRKSSFLSIATALGLSLALSGPALAAGKDMTARNNDTSSTAANPHGVKSASAGEIRASKLIGKNITNPKGESLGEIKDLVVDTTNGKVQYAVVSFGGFLGMGNKLFAYPLERFQSGANGDKLVLDMDKERMKSAPGFDEKSWPDFNKAEYRTEVDRWHQANGWKRGNDVNAAPTVRLARATKMLHADVKDSANKDIGDVEDMVVDLKSGKVRYVVAEFDPSWKPGDGKLVAVPMRAFKAEGGDRSDLVYQAGKDQLANAPTFDKNHWPDASDTRFRTDLDRYDQTWLNRPDSIGQATRR